MYGKNVERVLSVIDSVIAAIPDFSDVTCLPRVAVVSKNYDAAMRKVVLIEKNIYVKSDHMHNSIGSPYTELLRLKDGLRNVIRLNAEVDPHIKIQLMLCKVHQLALDAKCCVLLYGGYLEEGYTYIQEGRSATTK